MYTEIKSYQILIALLKKYGIRHCVLSAGSRNLPFVHSVEEDPYFKCYSVVDERSAGYFAIGLAQELNEPVVISCTSSTATCNYWPPVAEAFYQSVPLIILTSDRDIRMLGQWEDQMIDQVGMYDRHVKKSVNLPVVNSKDDEIYCQRLLNEALLEMNHNGDIGPIHINIPTTSYNITFNAKELPDVTKVERISTNSDDDIWNEKVEKLKNAKRILVICGQKSFVTKELKEEIANFFKKFNSTIIVDYMSNVNFEYGINTVVSMDSRYASIDKVKELLPDIVISFGGQVFSEIKVQLRKFQNKFEHWSIQENGKIVDLFKNITTIFECSPEYFFSYFNDRVNIDNDLEYYNKFKKYNDSVIIPPEFEYSNVFAIKEVVEKIPSNSILHLSINDSIRITNFFKLNSNIKTYANIGTHGIDGCLSSFLGQSAVNEKESFLIIGDLAFFYDMNALRLKNIKKNVHILLINNHGGSEFYFNNIWRNESSDLHTSARHNTTAEGWVKSNNFIYLSAHDKESFYDNLNTFMANDNEAPVFFEVFTEMKTDSEVIHKFYDLSRPRNAKNELMRKGKKYIKEKFGQERAKKIIDILKNK